MHCTLYLLEGVHCASRCHCLQRDWKRETIDSTGNETPPNHRERHLPRGKSRWKRQKIYQLLPPLDLLTFDPSVLLLAAVVKDFKGGGKEGGCFPTMHSELRRDLHLYYLPPFPSLPLPSLPPSPSSLGQAYLNLASYISMEMHNKRRFSFLQMLWFSLIFGKKEADSAGFRFQTKLSWVTLWHAMGQSYYCYILIPEVSWEKRRWLTRNCERASKDSILKGWIG